MRSATDFLPSTITIFMNLASNSLPYLGSGRISRFGAWLRLDMFDLDQRCRVISIVRRNGSGLRTLRAVLRTALPTVVHARAVERAAHRVIAHAGQVLHTAAADQHHRVLLQVVSLATDVAGHLVAVRQPDTRDLAHGRVGLLRRRGVHARANPALLGAAFQRRHRTLLRPRLAGVPD